MSADTTIGNSRVRTRRLRPFVADRSPDSRQYVVVVSPRGVEGVFIPGSEELRRFWAVHGDLACKETKVCARDAVQALENMQTRFGRMGRLWFMAA